MCTYTHMHVLRVVSQGLFHLSGQAFGTVPRFHLSPSLPPSLSFSRSLSSTISLSPVPPIDSVAVSLQPHEGLRRDARVRVWQRHKFIEI